MPYLLCLGSKKNKKLFLLYREFNFWHTFTLMAFVALGYMMYGYTLVVPVYQSAQQARHGA